MKFVTSLLDYNIGDPFNSMHFDGSPEGKFRILGSATFEEYYEAYKAEDESLRDNKEAYAQEAMIDNRKFYKAEPWDLPN